MDHREADQIARLLNDRNRLVVQYDADRIITTAENYLYLLSDDGDVTACLELKRVQWYQFEISHVTVSPLREGKGDARRLLGLAEERARGVGGRVLQCTIRNDNLRSQRLFERNGFSRSVTFYYPVSGNDVEVWLKAISLRD